MKKVKSILTWSAIIIVAFIASVLAALLFIEILGLWA